MNGNGPPLLDAHGLKKSFLPRRIFGSGPDATLRAVDGVDLSITAGEMMRSSGE